MNKKFIISIVVLISLFGLVAFWPKTTCDASGVGCRPSSQSQTKQPKAEIIQSELQNNTALLIDVREPDEFAADHAENAKNIPLGDIEAGKLTKANMTVKIYVYCRSGKRAGVAKTALEKQGYTNVENLGCTIKGLLVVHLDAAGTTEDAHSQPPLRHRLARR